jgi:hypothetical protein
MPQTRRGEYRHSSTLSLTSTLDGVGGQRHALAALPPGKTRYPLYRRLGGTQGRSERVWKISSSPGFDPRTAKTVASRYTDWAIPAPTQKTRMFLRWSTVICDIRTWGKTSTWDTQIEVVTGLGDYIFYFPRYRHFIEIKEDYAGGTRNMQWKNRKYTKHFGPETQRTATRNFVCTERKIILKWNCIMTNVMHTF